MILIKKQQKHQHYCQARDINMNILQVNKFFHLFKVKFTNSTLKKVFELQIKTIEDQVK